VTVFAHGLGGGIADTRPLGSGIPGSRIFFQLRGHGRSGAPPGPWSYADLAADLAAVADLHGATRALGVSLGAGALARLLVDRPDRFERLVFFLPAGLDSPRGEPARRRLAALFDAIGSGDPGRVAAAVAQEVPAALRGTPAVSAFARQRAGQLLRDGLAPGLGDLADLVAVPDPAALAAVSAPALVVACVGDELHPVEVAERLAGLLPRATLHVYDRPGVLWNARADLRQRIGDFLADRPAPAGAEPPADERRR
jgi:pimeloyl-ACP methyl ester carboxylesterase